MRTSQDVFECGDLPLQRGGTLRDARIVYKTFGTLSPRRDNVILYPTSYGAHHTDIEWLVNPEHCLDPSRYFIVIPNMFSNGLSSGAAETRDYPAVVTGFDLIRSQARMLEERFGLVQLSTGDMLRAAVAEGTEAGRAAQAVMAGGGLVSDEIVLGILAERMARPDTGKGVILDGFPRTAGQAAALDNLLASRGLRVTAAIAMEVEDEAMVDRVSGRYTCAGCGEGYHDSFKQPAVAGTCDKCGGTAFKRRADDTAETVRERLKAYHAQTAPLIAYYDGRGVLERIDAMADIDVVRDGLAAIVKRVAA